MLAREGSGDAASGWTYRTKTPDDQDFEIRLTGPDLPAAVPSLTISPADIPKDPKWQGTHRLVVAPPLIALDLAWDPDEPMRIYTFSRGDWEEQLLAMGKADA